MSPVHTQHPEQNTDPDPKSGLLTARTYAKINLILKVGQLDQSGMHPICSWMHSINLWDELSVEHISGSTSEFDIRWDDGRAVDWTLESDLVFKVHQRMEQRMSRPMPVRVVLKKSIPSGGGLGGGSSNAAGMAMALNQLFSCSFSERELQELVHKIGSDIPFFVDLESFNASSAAGPAVVEGIGDQITRTHRVDHELTLLIPDFGCPTGDVYRAFDQLAAESKIGVSDMSAVHGAAQNSTLDPGSLVNDLTSPALRSVPELSTLMSKIRQAGIDAKLSGSGSTMFVLGHLGSQEVDQLRTIDPAMSVLRTKLV
ncbi:MAG: 4-(cytidine 5'-diphospho)-2-C-methyl-D-erythritol kinase [Phycisphaerales bacterium]